MRNNKELIHATRPFAQEQRWVSWWHLLSTLAIVAVTIGLCCTELPWWTRLPISILAGLSMVRLFIIYHDQQHGSIFRGSKIAGGIMWLFGILTLNAPSVWRRSHDHHHHHNCRDLSPNIGSFPLMTVDDYQRASFWEKFGYSITRHPLTLAFGYLTVFGGSMTILPLLRNPRRHWDAALSLVCHVGMLSLLADEPEDLLFAGLLPFLVASGFGAYLFFAQHNFPGVRLRTGGRWDYTFSALHSSSYYKMNWLLAWFTGNIGYHHVHHLNSKIPFYRLPEAMAAIPELQTPVTVTLSLRDIHSCLRLKLYDDAADQLVPFPAAAKAKASTRPLHETVELAVEMKPAA